MFQAGIVDPRPLTSVFGPAPRAATLSFLIQQWNEGLQSVDVHVSIFFPLPSRDTRRSICVHSTQMFGQNDFDMVKRLVLQMI